MKAALCLIGTELTRGIIQDTHTKLVASHLDSLGYHITQVSIIPDDGTIRVLLEELSARTDIIICTGGLGPTSDDITRDLVASAAGVPLVEDADALRHLEQLISRAAGNANRRQIMIPEGFTLMSNPLGTAPGFFGQVNQARVFCLPGPPAEMERMFTHEVLPRISCGSEAVEAPLELSTFLIPESQLEEFCEMSRVEGVSWGTRVQSLKISLYLRGGSESDQLLMVRRLQEHAGAQRIRLGGQPLAERIIDYLKSAGLTCVLAESCTGGMVGKVLTDVPGSSSVFWGSYVSYADEAKQVMLGVSRETLSQHGAVSEQTVTEMAVCALQRSGADIACAVSGIAGPGGGTEEKPVGTVCFAAAGKGREPVSLQWRWGYPRRDLIRRRAVIMSLLILEAYAAGHRVLDIVQDWQYS